MERPDPNSERMKQLISDIVEWMCITAYPLFDPNQEIIEDKIKSHSQYEISIALAIVKQRGLDKVAIGCRDPIEFLS